jgi:hypothetical protein
MINIYRAQAENRLGIKFGRKEGRTVYFNAEEIREILKSRETSNSGNMSSSRNFQEAVNFSNMNDQAEASALGGMEAIVNASDQQAIAIGQAIGQRFVQVVWTTAIGTMQHGMTQMGQRFDEMHQAVALPLQHSPQLPGSDPTSPRLEAGEE